MILSSALHRMIDQTEAFIFINTPHSINIEDELGANPTTSSAWIFSELYFVSRVQRIAPKRILERLKLKMEASSQPSLEDINESVEIRFGVNLPKYRMDFKEFNHWVNNQKKEFRSGMRFGDFLNRNQSDGHAHLEKLYRNLKII
ncbi:hypothetical protein [Comamonas aquatica]|nr:hypothetical protein [Comamonas aquatica]